MFFGFSKTISIFADSELVERGIGVVRTVRVSKGSVKLVLGSSALVGTGLRAGQGDQGFLEELEIACSLVTTGMELVRTCIGLVTGKGLVHAVGRTLVRILVGATVVYHADKEG